MYGFRVAGMQMRCILRLPAPPGKLLLGTRTALRGFHEYKRDFARGGADFPKYARRVKARPPVVPAAREGPTCAAFCTRPFAPIFEDSMRRGLVIYGGVSGAGSALR